jgi:hypothetical protein
LIGGLDCTEHNSHPFVGNITERCRRSLECRDERQRVCSADAKLETGIVAKIGTGFVLL